MTKNWTRVRAGWRTTSLSMEESKIISTKNWFMIGIDHDGFTRGSIESAPVPYINSARREKILDWCHNHCKKHWSEEGILSYLFEDEEDSVLFALNWC